MVAGTTIGDSGEVTRRLQYVERDPMISLRWWGVTSRIARELGLRGLSRYLICIHRLFRKKLNARHMVSRRRGVVNFLLSLVGLAMRLFFRSRQRERDNHDDPPPMSSVGVVAGGVWRIAYRVAYDQDFGGIESSRLRHAGYVALSVLIQQRLFTDEFREGFGVGEAVGSVCYSFWNGVVRPPQTTTECRTVLSGATQHYRCPAHTRPS